MKGANLGPAPLVVSDRTCLQYLGVEWRTLRAFLEGRGVRITHVGRRPVVPVAVVLAEIESDRAAWSEADTAAEIERETAPRLARPAHVRGVPVAAQGSLDTSPTRRRRAG